MITLLTNLWPELTLCATACLLLVIGSLGGPGARRLAPVLALVAVGVTIVLNAVQFGSPVEDRGFTNAVGGGVLAQYVKLLTGVAGALFILLAWPTRIGAANADELRASGSGGNGSLATGTETAEYFALLLLSLAGVMLTAGANSFILLFLGLELASIPTYVMVSISRPLPAAQEAGVKYFFLGALSAALMLLGFSYLYGATGTIYLQGSGILTSAGDASRGILEHFLSGLGGTGGTLSLSSLEKLGLVLLIAAFGFKMAAVPLHVYVADVYQGAASPLTAMLSYVPKAAGLLALIKILIAFGITRHALPHDLILLLAIIAVLTMSVGNVLALLQSNIKRAFAYSSVAHSGYLLAGVTAILSLPPGSTQQAAALSATLFYLAVYAVMNTGVFAVLQQLPAARRHPDDESPQRLAARGAASAETYEDLAGQGRLHPGLGFVMAICCLSLVGVPTTAGFLGKLVIARALIDSALVWLLVAMMINAAVSSAYYLRIPASLFFRGIPSSPLSSTRDTDTPPLKSFGSSLAAWTCAVAVLVGGIVVSTSAELISLADQAATDAVRGDLPHDRGTDDTGSVQTPPSISPSISPSTPSALTAAANSPAAR